MQRLAALQLFCLWYAAAGRESRSLVTSAQSNGPHEDFLWDLKVSSLRACALACTVDDKCSFFSFWKNSLEGGPQCRGHSQQPASTSKQPVSTPDAVTFQVSKFWVSEESQGYSGNTDSTQMTVPMLEDNGSNTGGGVEVSSPCSPIQSTQADVGTGSPTLEELATGGNQEETATVQGKQKLHNCFISLLTKAATGAAEETPFVLPPINFSSFSSSYSPFHTRIHTVYRKNINPPQYIRPNVMMLHVTEMAESISLKQSTTRQNSFLIKCAGCPVFVNPILEDL